VGSKPTSQRDTSRVGSGLRLLVFFDRLQVEINRVGARVNFSDQGTVLVVFGGYDRLRFIDELIPKRKTENLFPCLANSLNFDPILPDRQAFLNTISPFLDGRTATRPGRVLHGDELDRSGFHWHAVHADDTRNGGFRWRA